MRGGVPVAVIAALAAAVLTLSTISSILLSCGVLGSYTPRFDVPTCSKKCSEPPYPGAGAYYNETVKAWKKVNSFVRAYEELVSLCNADFYDENGNPIESVVKNVVNGGRTTFYLLEDVVYYTGRANAYSIYELQNLIDTLEAAGVDETTEPGWLDLYSTAVSYASDLTDRPSKTEFGRLFREMEEIAENSRVFKTVRNSILLFFARQIRTSSILFPLLHPISMLYDLTNYDPEAVERYVNISIGLHGSVYSKIKDLYVSYDSLKEGLDRKAGELVEDSKKIYGDLEEDMSALRDLNLSHVARFLPEEVKVGTLLVTTSEAPAYSLTLARKLLLSIEGNYSLYRAGNEFLRAFENMKRGKAKLEELAAEVKEYKRTLEDSLERCFEAAKTHRFRVLELKTLASIELAVARSSSLPNKVNACRKLLELVDRDRKVSSVAAAAERCLESFRERWGREPACGGGDPSILLSCCEREMEREEVRFKASEQYLRYTRLYSTLEDVFMETGASDLLLELYTLPREPYNEEDLVKSYARLVSFYDRVKRKVSYPAGVRWEGELSADGISEVSLLVTNPLPISVQGYVDVPFSYVGYTVEGNGMVVRVEGKKVWYEGKGSVTVRFQTLPVELEEETISYGEGRVYIRLRNPYKLPVKRYTPYTVISMTDGTYIDGNYLVLAPGGTAVVEVPALDVTFEVEGEEVTFFVRNASPYEYEGLLTLDINASKGPSYCTLFETRAVCKLRLDPGEERMLTFTGDVLLRERDTIEFRPLGAAPSEAGFTVTEVPEPRVNTAKFDELMERLKGYVKRARELNSLDVLPIDPDVIEELEGIDDELKVEAVPVLSSINEKIRREAEVKTELLKKLADRTGDPELQSLALMAEKSLLTGDYVFPLAATKGLLRYFSSPATPFPDPVLLIIVGVAAFSVYLYTRRTGSPRKKRRIPKF